ncbi:ATP synthase F1 subunit delta [bacterium]|nr:ATP synthase F1 subunit delta [bacterium]
MNGGIGRRYAKALINLAGSDKNIEKIGQSLKEIAELYVEEKTVRNVILEPKLSKAKKMVFIGEITKKMKCDPLLNKYCRYLVSRSRFDLIGDIERAYNKLSSEKLGTATAMVVVSHKLEKKDEEALQKQLSDYTGKKVTLSLKVDESILGGAITSIDSLVLDGSIKNRLNLIRKTISKGN